MNTSQLVLKNWILWTHYYTRTENDRGVRKFRTVGYSSCTYEDVATITAIWEKKSYDLISNCISFSEAMVRFLMSDKCEGRKKKKTPSFISG